MKVPVMDVAAWRAAGYATRRFSVPEVPRPALERLSEVLGLVGDGLTAAAAVEEIIRQVRAGGDAALLKLTEAFDGVRLQAIEVTAAQRAAAAALVPAAEREAIDLAAERIRAFHELQRPVPVVTDELTLRPEPLARVGIYVPGGRARYPSTVLMNAIPAAIAGVHEVVMVSPPGPRGELPAAVLYAAGVAGVHRVFSIGGAQAVAALAYGTESVPAVDKVTGPGNIFVTLAKRAVFGVVDIDGLAGPTEIVIVADDSADEHQVMVDLASQLEHDPLAYAVLVTPSRSLAERVSVALGQDPLANRFTAGATQPLNACVVITADVAEAVEVASDFAPEHLELLVEDADEHLPQVRAAGMVFTGSVSPVPMGDYIAGSNHTLPTGGAARYASPLGVYDFYRWTTVVELRPATSLRLAPAAITLSRVEGLPAHERSLQYLLDRLDRAATTRREQQ
jgi:histidinol dehydrogenase